MISFDNTEAEIISEYLDSLKLSEDYCSALVSAVQAVLDRSHAIRDLHTSQVPEKMELARAKLRGARSKAKFDDLYKLDYAKFENIVLMSHKWLLWRACEPRRHRLLNDHFDRITVISKV